MTRRAPLLSVLSVLGGCMNMQHGMEGDVPLIEVEPSEGVFETTVADDVDPAEGRRAWRDTIDVPAQATVKIRLRLDDHPGAWMFHCHILEHAERGMAGELEVTSD